MPPFPTWLWIVAAACAAAAGLWLLIRGRPVGRRHGSRRCARCAYDMAALSSRTCPECGRCAKDERELLVRPPRRAWRVTGALLLMMGAFCAFASASRPHGWPSYFPDWVLVRVAPLEDSAWAQPRIYPTFSVMFTTGASPSPPFSQQVLAETVDRLVKGRLSDSATIHLMRRMYGLEDGLSQAQFAQPLEWPSDMPLSVHMSVPSRANRWILPVSAKARIVADGRGGSVAVCTMVYDERLELASCERSIDASRTADNFMSKRSTPDLDKAVAAAIRPRLQFQGDAVHALFDRRTESVAWSHVDFFLAYDVKILLEDKVLGTCRSWTERQPCLGHAMFGEPIDWRPGGKEAASVNPESLRLVITGNPRSCVNEFVSSAWTYPAEAWSGSVTVTPEIVRK